MLPRPRPAISRRSALGGAIGASAGTLLALTGCTPNASNAPRRRAERQRAARRRASEVDPDVVLAATVLADEQALLARVEATLQRFPG
ncbi:MAG: twin-arginine translocation signal domain-containing protein, partial [Nocardioides sp.]